MIRRTGFLLPRPLPGLFVLALLCLACTGGGEGTAIPGATLTAGTSTATEATQTTTPTEAPQATEVTLPDWLRDPPLLGNIEGYEAQLAYVDRAGDLRLVDASTGVESGPVLTGCEWYVGSKGIPPQWSADGSTVVCWSVDGVFAARPDEGSSTTPFAAGECGRLLSVGPTGSIACRSQSDAIEIRTWDGQPLATIPPQHRALRWSPSGHHVMTADPVRVYTLAPDGASLALPDGSGTLQDVAWSRNGGTIAYWSRQGHLLMADLLTRETEDIAPDSVEVEANRSARAYLVNGGFGLVLEGASHPIRLADGAALPVDLPQGWLLAVSPNGRYVAFAQYEGIDGDIVVVDLADGGEIRFEGALHVDGIDQTTIGLFSGDNARICWDAPGDQDGCADVAGPLAAESVEAPVVSLPAPNAAASRMQWLAPDGRHYASMQTGQPDDAEVDLALWSFEDGRVATVRLGSGFAYAWRPDGAYRQ